MSQYRASKEQLARFSKIRQEKKVTPDVAIFAFCLVYDVPYRSDIPVDDWELYLDNLTEEPNSGFAQGETDVNAALMVGMDDSERWIHQWGVGDEDHPYTEQDYISLDEIFRRYAARLNAAGGYDLQQEDTLRNCSRLALLRDKCVAKGDKDSIASAQKLDKMIQDNLASENLRKKDAKPIETARIDGIVDALRKKAGVGMELTKDQVFQMYFDWCRARHYPVTQDAVEHALLAIINCTRDNNDSPLLSELPKKARLGNFSAEFDEEASAVERETYDYLNLGRGWHDGE